MVEGNFPTMRVVLCWEAEAERLAVEAAANRIACKIFLILIVFLKESTPRSGTNLNALQSCCDCKNSELLPSSGATSILFL